MWRFAIYLIFLFSVSVISCDQETKLSPEFMEALNNGNLANEGFIRCIAYRDAWLKHADTKTGLIPRNLSNGQN